MEKTKQRLLRVLDLIKMTDEQHPITANEIVAELRHYGIEAERKAVLRDIEALVDYGNQITPHSENKLTKNGDMYEMTVYTEESSGLYFWLLQFGEEVTVVSPEKVRNEVIRRLDNIRNKYSI